MTTISNLGVGSGLDLNGLLDKLTQSEQAPLTAIQQQQSSYQTKLSAYGQLQSALTAFQSAAKALSDPSFFNATTAGSSNTGVLAATGSATAVSGSYAVNVTGLAQAQSLVSAGQSDQTTAIGSGTIHIDFGTISGGTLNAATGKYSGASFVAQSGSSGVDITIDSSNNSLQGIRDAINKANAGVTASIVNDGSGTPYRLVLNSNNSGAANSMRISVNDGGGALSGLLAYDPGSTTTTSGGTTTTTDGVQNLQQSVAAQNAQLTVNNIAIQSASNQVTDAIQGVTMNLAQTGSSSVTVQRDTTSIQKGVQAFVTAYNNLQSTITNLTAYDASTQTGSALTGDASTRIIQTQIRGVLNGVQTATGANPITTLSQVGVSFQTDGTLSLDTNKLNAALASNPSGVAAVFGNTDGKSGFGNQINNLVTTLTSTSGALTAATNGINSTLKDLSNQYTAMQNNIDSTIANYKAQFTQLDMIMSQMQSTSTYLTQQFSSSSSKG